MPNKLTRLVIILQFHNINKGRINMGMGGMIINQLTGGADIKGIDNIWHFI